MSHCFIWMSQNYFLFMSLQRHLSNVFVRLEAFTQVICIQNPLWVVTVMLYKIWKHNNKLCRCKTKWQWESSRTNHMMPNKKFAEKYLDTDMYHSDWLSKHQKGRHVKSANIPRIMCMVCVSFSFVVLQQYFTHILMITSRALIQYKDVFSPV